MCVKVTGDVYSQIPGVVGMLQDMSLEVVIKWGRPLGSGTSEEGHYISEDETPKKLAVLDLSYFSVDDTVISKVSHYRSEIIRMNVNEYQRETPLA